MVCAMVVRYQRQLTRSEMLIAIQRNFGGLETVEPAKPFNPVEVFDSVAQKAGVSIFRHRRTVAEFEFNGAKATLLWSVLLLVFYTFLCFVMCCAIYSVFFTIYSLWHDLSLMCSHVEGEKYDWITSNMVSIGLWYKGTVQLLTFTVLKLHLL